MKPHYLLIALTIGTLIFPATQPLLVSAQLVQLAQNDTGETRTKAELQRIAARVTVRIRVGQGAGSGVLIAKKGNTYLVMTNAHVVRDRGNITLQAPDGQSYAAQKVQNTQVGNFDVALLEFTSTRTYQLAGLDNFSQNPVIEAGIAIFAAGFPFDSNALKFVTGAVKQLPQEPFANGTQIGYATKGDVEQGMSGGPILDSYGNLVGINSTLAYPIKPAYTYADGRKAPKDLAAEYQQANWGVPMYNLLTRLNPDVLYSYKQLPKLRRAVTPSGYMAELDQKARLVTVRIENSGGNGSGVILAREGNSYYVLTAEHVMVDVKIKKPYLNHKIIAHDRRTYTIDPSEITYSEGTDLAVVKFTSTQPYQVATLGNYDISRDAVVFPGGWPAPQKIRSQQWQWQLNPGVVSSKEQGQFLTQDKLSFSNGYDLVYSSVTYGGMSGGPVFDRAGQVIGIHGKADGDGGTRNVLGNSLGISIKTFIGLVERLKLNPRSLQIVNTVPAALDSTKLASVNLVRSNMAMPSNDSGAERWIEYGNQLYRLGKDVEAVKAFDRAIAVESDSVNAHYGRGIALANGRNNLAALGSFDRAIQLVPRGNQSSYYYLWKYRSVALRDLNRNAEALVTISRAIDLEPQDPILLNEQAALLEQLKRYPESIAVYNNIIATEPKAWAYSNRGLAKSGLGDNKGALADYNTAIQIDPQFAKAYSNRGVLKADLGDKKAAITDFDTAIRIEPQFAAPYSNRGLAKSELGDKKGAITDFDTAIRIKPQFAEPYSNRGIVKSELGDNKGAMSDFDTAIRINPQSDKAYYNRGRVKYIVEDYQGAIADYDRAIQISPKLALAYLNRGGAKQKLKDYKGALTDYDAASLITPKDAKIYYNRGVVRDQLGDKKGALADYDTAILITPEDPKIYYRRSGFKSGLGDTKGALDDINSAIRLNPQYAEAYFSRGLFKYKSGGPKAAITDYTIAAQLFKAQNKMVLHDRLMEIIQAFSK